MIVYVGVAIRVNESEGTGHGLDVGLVSVCVRACVRVCVCVCVRVCVCVCV